MADEIPAVTGRQLIRLFTKDGWTLVRRANEGPFFSKRDADGRVRTTVIPDKRRPLTPGTLSAILGEKQSGIGRTGLLEMIQRHKLK